MSNTGTVEAWVYSNRSYPSDDGSIKYRSIVSKWTDGSCGGGNEGYLLDWYGTNAAGTLRGMICNGTNFQTVASSTNLVPNTWNHIVFAWDGAYLRLYMNGRPVGAPIAQTINSQDDSSMLWIGDGFNSGTTYRWDGKLDQVQIYNYARTPAQIAWDYNRGKPIGWWKMDEGEGTAVHDESGSGNHGTMTNMDAGSDWVEGKYNKALDFDGTDDYISIPDANQYDFGINDFSLSAWVYRPSGGKSSPGIFSKNSNPGYRLRLSSSDLVLGLYDGTWHEYGSVNFGFQDDRWQHILVTLDRDGQAAFYLNGQLKSSSNISAVASINLNNSVPLLLGDDSWCRLSYCGQFIGKLDDVRIYNYVLTEQQIKQIQNDGAIRYGE